MEHVKKRDPFGVVPQWIGLIQTASNASIVYKQTSENIGKKIIQLCFWFAKLFLKSYLLNL